ncbi:MAG: hypothetical protein CYG60_18945 [Actinobacteria bacterium]|nr:MAG: hypothetical protein CYG60_18945 [Actinomycetota bacterium]
MRQMPSVDPVFRAELVRVIDADSLVVSLDRWFGDRSTKTLRLLGCDAPELTGSEKDAGMAAREWALGWLVSASGVPYRLVVQTSKPDSFGRVLAYTFREFDGACLNTDLVAAGHARAVSELAQMKAAREG